MSSFANNTILYLIEFDLTDRYARIQKKETLIMHTKRGKKY